MDADPSETRPARKLHGACAPDSPYRWQKGKVVNPGGRPKGLERIARDVVGANGGYEALIQFLCDVAVGRLSSSPGVSIKDRIRATEILRDCMGGRPRVALDVTTDQVGAPTADPADYSAEQVRAVRAILEAPAIAAPEIFDAEIVEDE